LVASTSYATHVADMLLIYDHTTLKRPIERESHLKEFMRSCFPLMKDKAGLNALHRMIDHCVQERELLIAQRVVNQVLCKNRMSNEFRLSAHIGDYDMDQVILDLGSNVKVLSKKTWETMGKSKLILSPVWLILVNQHRIVPIGQFLRVPVNIDKVHNVAYFEFIDIVDNSQPYPVLMGID
jgi:hypothetical protein